MQTKNKLDKETLQKVLRGATIAATGTFALFLLDFIGTLELENALLTGFIAWFVPTITNLVREWMKGV
jgi:hypothetical protein